MIRTASTSVSGQHRLGDPGGLVGLPGRPRQVAPQSAVLGFRPRPGLVDHEPQPAPGVPGARPGGGHLEHPPFLDDRRQHLTGRQPPGPRMQPAQVRDGPADRMLGPVGRYRGEDVERPAARAPGPQVVVAAPEQRRPQRGHAGELVAGVGDRPQGGHQVADLGRLVHQRTGLGPVGDVGRIQRGLQERQRGAGRQQDRDVGRSDGPPLSAALIQHGPALGESPTDDCGDVGRLGRPQLLGVGSVMRVDAEHGHRRSLARPRSGARPAPGRPVASPPPPASARRTPG